METTTVAKQALWPKFSLVQLTANEFGTHNWLELNTCGRCLSITDIHV